MRGILKSYQAKLSPNPNNGSFNILLDEEIKDNIAITVFDIFGELVYSTNANGSSLDVNIPDLPLGLYLVKLNSNELNETLKFIKQ